MKAQTINNINSVNNIVANLQDWQKSTQLRQLEIGYDLHKEPGLKEYRRMTVGEFLIRVNGYDRIPRKIVHIIEAIGFWVTCGSSKSKVEMTPVMIKETEHTVNEAIAKKKVLPMHAEGSFIEQAHVVFDTLISSMMTLSDCNVRIAERLKLAFDQNLSDKKIGELTSNTSECVRLARSKFQSDVMKGVVVDELSEEFEISDSFCREAQSFAAEIENHTLDSLTRQYPGLSEANIRFIIQALGLNTLNIEGREYIIPNGRTVDYRRVVEVTRMSLRREFDYTPIDYLCRDLDEKTSSFVVSFLKSRPGVYQFSKDKTSVRMVGDGLQKIARVARIIFDSGRLISKEDIEGIYYTYYMCKAPCLQPTKLKELGFHCQNKSGKWQFGEPMPKLQDVIRNIITSQRPIATLKTIVSAASNAGLDYPISTIRAYVTDIATPENKQNDLFCLKGYGHLYPNYSWRKFNRAIS